MAIDNFINVKLSVANVDTYLVRASIFESLKLNLKNLSGILLDVGCGQMPYKKYILENSGVKKYISLDIESAIDYGGEKPDLYWDGVTIPVDNASIDCVIATEVLEHCSFPDIIIKEICRVLKPQGKLVFTVPFLWPLHEVPHDAFRYTPFMLERLLSNNGFSQIDLKPLGGWDASLAQMIGLWVKRRGFRKRYRIPLSLMAIPLIKILKWIDRKPVEYCESCMITGLSGVAVKKKI